MIFWCRWTDDRNNEDELSEAIEAETMQESC